MIKMIKSRRMRWAGRIVRMGEEKCVQHFGLKNWREETTGRS